MADDKQTIINIPERHAFCIVGEDTLFLCHQIMTHMEPHAYELILEVEIPEDAKRKIFADRDKNGKSHFFGNKDGGEFTLPSIVSGNRTSFTADVWNTVPDSDPPDVLPEPPWAGLWNKPTAEPWLSDVKVTIKRIAHFRHLNRNEHSRKFESYILFGRGKEAHILHSVLFQPEYDHVASLKEAPDWIDEEQLISTVEISLPHLPYDNYSTYTDNPLPDNSRHRVLYYGLTEYRDPMGALQNKIPELYIEVGHTWWFSTKIINYWNYQLDPKSKQIS